MTDRRDLHIAELERRNGELERRNGELERRNGELERRVGELEALVTKLRVQLGQNSSNSSMPPSTDRGKNAERNKAKAARRKRRGAKKGRKGSHRQLVPAERVDETVERFPAACAGCGKRLPKRAEDEPWRHQTVELPELRAHVTEYRMNAVRCGCGCVTRAELPMEVGRRVFGPGLVALVVLLTGYYRMSKRRCADFLETVLGIDVSVGAVSGMEEEAGRALEPAHQQAWEAARTQPVAYVDETSWRQENQTHWLWVLVTSVATVFLIRRNRSKDCAKELLGDFGGTLVSDRYAGYAFWPGLRQVCWAHLLRLFRSFSERKEGTLQHTLGHQLLEATGELFGAWHRFREGEISRLSLRRRVAGARRAILDALRTGKASLDLELANKCKSLLEHEDALFTFLYEDGVEPTNNHAERALRHAVILRKLSFGTQSHRGSRFLERMFTVVETTRGQGGDILRFLHGCITAHRSRLAPPSLLCA